MSTYTVAIVGTGPDPAHPSVEGFAMGYRHAEAYRNDDRCRLVGCADIVPENGRAFADAFGLAADAVYEDYERMVADLDPDVVSVAVPPAVHEPVVVGCARAGIPAIHCEKPMAADWAGAQRMVQACWRRGVQLTFNRQRRFARPVVEAKRLLDDGVVGDLRRIEIGWGDFYDTGAHTVDLAGMFNDERPADWVLAALDYRDEDRRFGAHQENQMWAQWRYDNGVYGVLSTGAGAGLVDAAIVLRGSDGTIRLDVDGGPMLDVGAGADRRTVDVEGESMHATGRETDRYGSELLDRVVAEIVDALDTGRESALGGRTGLNTAEILFAGYESVRRRGRVDLPLDVDDNALEAMVESGDLEPEPRPDE